MAALSASVHGGGLPNDTHTKPPEQLALQWEVRTSIAGMTLALCYSDHQKGSAVPVSRGATHQASQLHAFRCVGPEITSSSVDPIQRSHRSTAAAAMVEETSNIPRASSSTSSESYQTCGDATESFHSTLSGPHASGFWAQSSVSSQAVSGRDGSAFESGTQQPQGSVACSDGERATWPNWSGDGMATEQVEAAIAAADMATRGPLDGPQTAGEPMSTQNPLPSPPYAARSRGRLQVECSDVIVDASSVGNRTTVTARLYALSGLETLPEQHGGTR